MSIIKLVKSAFKFLASKHVNEINREEFERNIARDFVRNKAQGNVNLRAGRYAMDYDISKVVEEALAKR